MESPPRLLLVEFLVFEGQRTERAMFFPYWLGLARAQGVTARWVCLGTSATRRMGREDGRVTVVDPEAPDREALLAVMAAFGPTHVALSELPSPRFWGALEAAVPGVRLLPVPAPKEFFYCRPSWCAPDNEMLPHVRLAAPRPDSRRYYGRTAWFLEWLGLAAPGERAAPESPYLIEATEPCYEAHMLNEAARWRASPLTLLSGFSCTGRPSAADNPRFAGVDMGDCRVVTGCTFCGGSPPPAIHGRGVDSLTLVGRQLRAALATGRGPDGRDRGHYDLLDLGLFTRADEVFALADELGVPPATFYFSPRIDDVIGAARRLEALLPRVASAGHRMRMLVMGLENFSPSELERFNKGITPEQVDALTELAADWGRRFPGVFKLLQDDDEEVEWGFILWTPWTTLEDLRVNLRAARQRRFARDGWWLVSALLVLRATPLASLARHEGDLLGDRYGDPAIVHALTWALEDMHASLPWRFRHADAGDVFALIARAFAARRGGDHAACFEGDPLFAGRQERAQVHGVPSCMGLFRA